MYTLVDEKRMVSEAGRFGFISKMYVIGYSGWAA